MKQRATENNLVLGIHLSGTKGTKHKILQIINPNQTNHQLHLLLTRPFLAFFPQGQTELVVSTHLKNISQIGSFPQVGVKIKIFETTT